MLCGSFSGKTEPSRTTLSSMPGERSDSSLEIGGGGWQKLTLQVGAAHLCPLSVSLGPQTHSFHHTHRLAPIETHALITLLLVAGRTYLLPARQCSLQVPLNPLDFPTTPEATSGLFPCSN